MDKDIRVSKMYNFATDFNELIYLNPKVRIDNDYYRLLKDPFIGNFVMYLKKPDSAGYIVIGIREDGFVNGERVTSRATLETLPLIPIDEAIELLQIYLDLNISTMELEEKLTVYYLRGNSIKSSVNISFSE